MQVDKLISAAQKILVTDPYDKGHDICHHFKVMHNCLEIIVAEDIKGVNLDYLQLAAWWHDVDRKTKDHPRFMSSAKMLGFSDEEIAEILTIINGHSYSDERSDILEAKILFDADKIEYVGHARWLYITVSIKNDEMGLDKGIKYALALNERIAYVMENINFKHTKKMLKQEFKQLQYLRDNNLLIQEINEKIDWNLLKGLLL